MKCSLVCPIAIMDNDVSTVGLGLIESGGGVCVRPLFGVLSRTMGAFLRV